MFAACLCCREKVPKNEFMGLEGMVKLKSLDDSIVISSVNGENVNSLSQNNLSLSSNSGGGESDKRASNGPRRSLPDIPLVDNANDNGSELYATVADKVNEQPNDHAPIAALRKQTSISQQSSISQADDVSSPYARVKTPCHDYDKVRTTEHPYAQLNAPSSIGETGSNADNSTSDNANSRRGSRQSLLGVSSESQLEIPAASAIAGMVSASQELPYMTPPIVQQPHFSGDSQDSSKGYTSISVREPLANIMAQAVVFQPRLAKEGNDSHYATVSDDSDEMYAAIEYHNNQADIYTSGSETYAQIQPANAITVAAEINSSTVPESVALQKIQEKSAIDSSSAIVPPVDSIRAQMHSRQASSSSNTNSLGNLGSPKPEKRQANSPLPPTPKNSQFVSSNSNLTSTSSIASGRNSVTSVLEVHLPLEGNVTEESPGKKNVSPSKDIDGMYSKVMKKSKLLNNTVDNTAQILQSKLNESEVLRITEETSNTHSAEDTLILYATVPEKGQDSIDAVNRHKTVSQQSSLSEADDVTSPYARVKGPLHDYDTVRIVEHPYAQLRPVSTHMETLNHSDAVADNADISSRQNSVRSSSEFQHVPTIPSVIQHSHFSGDSQDSSKGYTSISVREPLNNIMPQTGNIRHPRLLKDGNDPHYATVAGDSDDTYAAIEFRNNPAEVYTSDSETYAQIQPGNSTIPAVTTASKQEEASQAGLGSTQVAAPIPPSVDSIRAQVNANKALSSSSRNSVDNLGSPKPEKRQVNSPLPPTPNANATSEASAAKPNNSSPSKNIDGMYSKVMKKNKVVNAPPEKNAPILDEHNHTDEILQIYEC